MSAATRRVLTGEQMSMILAAIRAVDHPAALLSTVLAHLYDTLLRGEGRRLADLNEGSPDDWQIPVTQWEAIAQAASDQARQWGTGPQLRADLLDRMPGCFDDPAAPTGSQPPPAAGGGLRLLCVSVRGSHAYLVGNPSVRPVDLGPAAVPAGVGTRFASLDEIKHYVATKLRGVSSVWQVRVIDEAGTVVMYGFRSGTGGRWSWRGPSTPATDRPPEPRPGRGAG